MQETSGVLLLELVLEGSKLVQYVPCNLREDQDVRMEVQKRSILQSSMSPTKKLGPGWISLALAMAVSEISTPAAASSPLWRKLV